MSVIHRATFTSEEMTAELNKGKEIFLRNMVNEKLLTQDQVNELNQYCLVVHQKSVLGRFWDRVWGSDQNAWMISVVKMLTHITETDGK